MTRVMISAVVEVGRLVLQLRQVLAGQLPLVHRRKAPRRPELLAHQAQ